MSGFFVYNNTMQAILSLHHVDFSQSGFALLQGIDLALYRGQVLGLLGVNGAGKSTTLKIAAGLLTPTGGQVSISPQARIGYLPEIPPLIDSWSVKGFLHHVCHLHQLPAKQRGEAVERVIKLCRLEKIFNQSIATLSKGNRQRAAIAQSIIHQPDILILDEPTSGLDPQQISFFRQLIQEIKPQTAILLSSHIMQEITTLCDSVAIIHQGQKQQGLALHEQQGIVIEFSHPVSPNELKKLPQWQSGTGTLHRFAVSSASEQNKLLQHLLAMRLSIHRISGSEQILENTFLQLIGQNSADISAEKTEETAHG